MESIPQFRTLFSSVGFPAALQGIVADLINGDIHEQSQIILRFAVAWPRALRQAMHQFHRIRARRLTKQKVFARRLRRHVQAGMLTAADAESVISEMREYHMSVLVG